MFSINQVYPLLFSYNLTANIRLLLILHINKKHWHFFPVIIMFWGNVSQMKAVAPHSSTLAWKIPRTEEPGGPQSMVLLRVGQDWATSLFTFMHWRRKWQPTPVFLPVESQGWQSLSGCHLWGRTESDTTEAT